MKHGKALIMMLIIISIVSIFIARRYFSSLIKYYGVEFKTDEEGHFTEDISYKDGDTTYIFFKTESLNILLKFSKVPVKTWTKTEYTLKAG